VSASGIATQSRGRSVSDWSTTKGDPVKRLAVLFIPVLLLLLLPTAALAKSSPAKFDRALDKLFQQGYPQELEQYFVSLGTNPDLGFRWAGTSAEKAVAQRTFKALKAAGLRGVKYEPVPVDVFDFKRAAVTTASGLDYMASSFAGTPPTGPDGIKADLVYVGNGTKAAFDAAEAASGPVAGKLVLIDLDFGVDLSMNLPGAEAAHRGALGVIMTYGDGGYYSYAADALGSFDATYQYDWAPMVYVSKTDGDVLRAEVQAAMAAHKAYKATMVCDTKVKLADDGGTAYNVIGTLPGKNRGQAIVLSAHMDAHFRAGMDDTAALVNMITIAKAMRTSGHLPNYDIVFLATAGEEFGYTNCYYDWLTGSWYAATETHKDWAGKVRAFIGLELMGLKGARLGSSTSEELVRLLQKVAADNPDLVPYGTNFTAPVYCWNDQWPFAAEGIPGMRFGTSNPTYSSLYHTNYETIDLVNYDYLAKIAKFIFRTEWALENGLLPYDLPARAKTLAASVDGDALLAAGADADTVARLVDGVAAFSAACNAYDAGKGSIRHVESANCKLVRIEKIINDEFTALDCWDYTIYPHEQIFRDVQKLNASLGELGKAVVDPDAAAGPLWGVGQMYYGLTFSYDAFVDDQQRHDPGYYRIAWGGQGQLAPYLDLVAEYDQIYAGEYAAAEASLTDVRDSELGLLDQRLAHMADVLEVVTPKIESLTP
jgi:Zn-dependent M28 family amino/carboxypeptidase